MRKYSLCAMLVLSLAVPALANLPLGGQWYNPDLAGSGEVGDGGPYYTSGQPAWLDNGNLLASLTSPIAGIPGFGQFAGTVESWVYQVNSAVAGGGAPTLGFVYRINLNGNSASRLVRASLASPLWASVNIFDAGADGSGTSSAATGNTTWSDGDPYFIEREASLGTPAWNFRFGNDGTTLNPNENSALVWFETDALGFSDGGTISLLDGGSAGAARILTVGTGIIPSPQAATLGLVGVGMVGLLRRRF